MTPELKAKWREAAGSAFVDDLICMNDSGVTFSEIANFIERKDLSMVDTQKKSDTIKVTPTGDSHDASSQSIN